MYRHHVSPPVTDSLISAILQTLYGCYVVDVQLHKSPYEYRLL